MRIKNLMALLVLLLPVFAQSQIVTQSQVTTGHSTGPKKDVFYLHQTVAMGRWWQDSDVAQQLQLTDNQIAQLNQVFTQHRLNLHGDLQEEVKANQGLEALLGTEQLDDDQVNSQVDQVLNARNKLQREFTTMNVDFRKVLTLEQWKQLKAMRHQKVRTIFKSGPGPGGAGAKTVIVDPGGPDGTPGPTVLPQLPDSDF